MDHVAYMKKSWGLLPKILSGDKTIESRWYQSKHCPWGKINTGDTVYFKNSGQPITAKAVVKNVLSFAELTPIKVQKILDQYSKLNGIEPSKINYFYNLFKNKSYCLLIFLSNPQIIDSFDINKSSFGAMSAWITIANIDTIRVRKPAVAERLGDSL